MSSGMDELALGDLATGTLDVERDSDVPISTQIYWQLAYQIDSGRLLPGATRSVCRRCPAHGSLLVDDRPLGQCIEPA